MTGPSEGDRYRDDADVLWEVDDPHHSGSDQGIVLKSETSGMTLRLSDEGFQRRVKHDHLIPVERTEGDR